MHNAGIDSIRLGNFQSHEGTLLELHPRVNAITGWSDVGKSSILRGARLVMENRPGGDAFIRHGAKSCEVALAVDGQIVVREKGRKNLYHIDDEVYAAPGTNVPDEVRALLNIHTELQCQWQHDPPFLLGKAYSPGEVAKRLNEAVRLEEIDIAMSAINGLLTRTKQAHDRDKDSLDKVDAQLVRFKGLAQLGVQVAVLEQQEKEIITLARNRRELDKAANELREQLRILARGEAIGKLDLVQFSSHIANFKTHRTNYRAIKRLHVQLATASARKRTLHTIVGVGKGLDEKLAVYRTHQTAMQELSNAASNLHKALDLCNKKKEKLTGIQATQKDALAVCPTCGRSG